MTPQIYNPKILLLFIASAVLISCHKKSQNIHHQSSEIKEKQAPLMTLQELAATKRPAVYLLDIYDKNNVVIGSGSGFGVNAEGFLLTNRHVIENAQKVTAKSANGAIFKVSGIVAYARDIDAVILKMESPELFPHIKFPTDQFAPVAAGDPVAVIGNPLGLEGSLSNGIVAAIRPDNGKTEDPMAGFVQITAPISAGSSGSPVFNMRGEIIGMATCGFGNAQNINFAIPAKKLINLLSDSQYASGDLIKFDSLSSVRLTQAAIEVQMSEEYREYNSANMRGDQSKALIAAKSLIEKFPKNNVAHFYLGVAYRALDLNAEAIKSYQKATTLNPGDLAAWMNSGICLGEEGQHAQAIQSLQRALEIDPQHRGVWCVLGDNLWAMNDFDSAEKAIRKEIALYPNDGIAWLALSRVLYSQGEFDTDKIGESKKALKQAVLLGEPKAIRLSEALKKIENRPR